MTARGFFSVIRFCPDLERGEAANVGVVLAVPELGFLEVCFGSNEAPKQRFGADAFDEGRLNLAKQALKRRILSEGSEWSRADDLQLFARKEGNNLLLSSPQVALVEEPQASLHDLYARIVHVEPTSRHRVRKPDLRTIFEPHLKGVPLQKDVHIEVEGFGPMTVPYSYKNGKENLVLPEAFPLSEKRTINHAAELAARGRMVHKYAGGLLPRQLIVVAAFDPSASTAMKDRVSFLLKNHEARLVCEDQVGAFVEEVRRDAHS